MNKKIIVPPVNNKNMIINKFSDKINKILSNAIIVDNIDGTESIKLELGDRIVTIILDQSGSMTWNDNQGFRYEVAKEVLQNISDNYPGIVKYNLIKYGATFINVLFFGVIDDGGLNPVNITDFNTLFFSDDESNFAGIRVVKNVERTVNGQFLTYPTSPVDGKIVSQGFISKSFSDNLVEGTTYYYTVYTYDNKYRFSDGVKIQVSPRDRIIPRGVTIFKSFNSTNKIGSPLIGSGIQRDENVIGLWHFNETKGDILFDFSNNKNNLQFIETSPEWIEEKSVPAGVSGIRFKGSSDSYAYKDISTGLNLDLSDNDTQMTIMFWLYPYNIDNDQVIIENANNSIQNYVVGISPGGYVYFKGNSGGEIKAFGLEEGKWQHVVIVINGGALLDDTNVSIYINGEDIEIMGNTIPLSSPPDLNMYIGVFLNGGVFLSSFYGKLTEISIHNIVRSSEYINTQVSVEPVLNKITKLPEVDVITGEIITQIMGKKGDNGDRIIVMEYTVPQDANYIGGDVIVVRNEKNTPTWEGDGVVILTHNSVTEGTYYFADVDDFVHGTKYYYRIYSKNTIGNYSYPEDSTFLFFDIPLLTNPLYLPVLTTALRGPSEPFGVSVILAGNKKILLRWKNNELDDERIKRVKIYYSNTTYPTVNDNGGSDGQLLFIGVVTDNKFVHRKLINGDKYYYTIFNVDKYGRASSEFLTVSAIPTEDSIEDEHIPLLDIEDLHYEIVNNQAVSVVWTQPVKSPENIEAFFDQTILLYATITDEFGQGISEDTIVEMELIPTIETGSLVDDVFTSGEKVLFEDNDAYQFVVSGIQDGVIRASLQMSRDPNILSQIKKAQFTLRIKSYIPANSGTGRTASDRSVVENTGAVGTLNNYVNLINSLLNETNNGATGITSGNIFEYISSPITVKFSNPWEIELENRDKRFVSQKCYYYEQNALTGHSTLSLSVQNLDGAYIRSSTPFVIRAKLTYKGEPISVGKVNVAIWDAKADLCQCAGYNKGDCYPVFTKENRSEVVLSADVLSVVRGIEKEYNNDGSLLSEKIISYVDIPLYAPDMPRNVILYVKGKYSGYSSLKSLPIVFQNILRIDLNANAPRADGGNKAEQQSTVYIINPDSPENKKLYTYPVNNSIVEWGIKASYAERYNSIGGGLLQSVKDVNIIQRNLYSIDNVPLFNGVYSYTRNGTARNVFLGPVENRMDSIKEAYEISAKIVYNGLSDEARQEIDIDHLAKEVSLFGARFLIETEYNFLYARNDRLWTDGIDYKKIFISRNPSIADIPDFKYGGLFRSCMAEENYPILELNPSGQIININGGDEELEFVWGEVEEKIDPYNGRKYIEIGEDGYSSKGTALIELKNAEISDKTTVYIRCNKFTYGASCDKDINKDDCYAINSPCLGLTTCDLPLGNTFISGETYLFVNGKPLKLVGGGSEESGIPPCPICYNEPLRVKTIWTKVNGENTPSLGSFIERNGKTLLQYGSVVDIRVEISFSGYPVPEGTFVYVVIGNNSGRNIFSADRNIVQTFVNNQDVVDEYDGTVITAADGKSYADVHIGIRTTAHTTISEGVEIFSIYDEKSIVERHVGQTYMLILEVIDTEEESSSSTSSGSSAEASSEEKIYSQTMERYNIEKNIWEYVTNMSVPRSDAFVASNNDYIYVMGGVEDDLLTITSFVEKYNTWEDTWEDKTEMITPRFGGMTVVVEDKIYTIGGVFFDDVNNHLQISRKMEVFDTVTEQWQEKQLMPIFNGGTYQEVSYGVAYGIAEYVEVTIGSEIKKYIYILSGITEIYDVSGNIQIEKMNDRVLRYDIDNDLWEFSRILYSNELYYYQRLSPLSITDGDKIIVFNGAIEESLNNYIFPTDVFYIEIDESLDLINIKVGGSNFGTTPITKYRSTIIKNGDDYYILGGANDSTYNMDILEKINISLVPYEYDNSEGTLSPLLKGRNGMGVGVGEYMDEYTGGERAIYIIGGRTNSKTDGYVDITFE